MSETIIELKNLSIGYGNKKVLQSEHKDKHR